MTNNIVVSGINANNIDNKHLLLSILKEGLREGLYSKEQIEIIQSQLMIILSESIPEYTHFQSSSVKTETAQDILQSIIYSIDYYIMKQPIDKSVLQIAEKSIKELFDMGQAQLKLDIKLTKQLLEVLKESKLEVDLFTYNETIENDIEMFFDGYDEKFDGSNTSASIDYPLLFDDMSWTGLTYIKNYIESLIIENKFCRHFSILEINMIIASCGKKFSLNSNELLVNISELILNNAICLIIIGKRAEDLIINQIECDLLYKKLKKITKSELKEIVIEALEDVFLQLGIDNEEIKRYYRPFADGFSTHLFAAIEEKNISNFITLVGAQHGFSNSTYYEAGTNMSDEKLRAVIEEIKVCSNGERKADLIKAEIRNIEDLKDIFGAYCIFDDEYKFIFDTMSDFELKLLASEISDFEDWHLTENEAYWQAELIKYLHIDRIIVSRVSIYINIK